MWGGIARFCTVWMTPQVRFKLVRIFHYGDMESRRRKGQMERYGRFMENSPLVNFQRHEISVGLAAGLVISVDLAIVPVTGKLVGADQ